jgi:hypothetical protein
MWATLTLMTALSMTPQQADGLKLTNERVTYGMMGPTRAEKKYLPGDTFFIGFDIEGLKKTKGQFYYSMRMELQDSKGTSKFKSETEDRSVIDVLGGNKVPALAHSTVGIDQEPGEYTLTITVTDRAAKASQTLVRKFEVVPRDFGIVRLQMTYGGAVPTPPVVVVGQAVVFTFGVVGFERDRVTKQPNVRFEMRVLDEAGKPTLEEPIASVVNEGVDEKASGFPQAIDVALTRAGKFTVELKATDTRSKKTSAVSLPITVVDVPK